MEVTPEGKLELSGVETWHVACLKPQTIEKIDPRDWAPTYSNGLGPI